MYFAKLHTPHTHRGFNGIRFYKVTTVGTVIPNEFKYNLHYEKVRGDVL